MLLEFVNKFVEFFFDKKIKIWIDFDVVVFFFLVLEVKWVCFYMFDEFNMVIVEDVCECVVKLFFKLCELDFFFGFVIRNVLDILLLFIFKIINMLL